MAEEKTKRLKQVATEFNIGISTVIEYLGKKGFVIENNPNSKITPEHISLLKKEFESSLLEKKEASEKIIGKKHSDNVVIDTTGTQKVEKKQPDEEEEIFIKNLAPEKREEVAVPVEAPKEVVEQPKEAPVAKAQPVVEAAPKQQEEDLTSPKLQGFKVVGKIDLTPAPKKGTPKPEPKPEPKAEKKPEPKPEKKAEPVAEKKKPAPVETPKAKEEKAAPVTPVAVTPEVVIPALPIELVEGKAETLKGLTVLGKIDLGDINKDKKKGPGGKPVASSDEADKKKGAKRKRKRVRIGGDDDKPKVAADPNAPRPAAGSGNNANRGGGNRGGSGGGHNKPRVAKEETSTKEIQSNIRSTMSKMAGGKPQGGNRSKYRREKRSGRASAEEGRMAAEQESAKTLRVTEFISASDMASLMDVSVNEVISTCLSLGMFVSINQRLDAEAITIIADEFGYDIEFVTAEEETKIDEAPDEPESLKDRAPIVTIMGHVDHGKTSLLDYIRKTRVVAGEAGGITQHIGAYNVQTDSGKNVTFLDTPGHEAFTAMRARGAKLTDIVVIVVAADDNVMPQTKEAINHAMVAGVPIVIAITKIDKPSANPDKVKEELSKENILVEDWGGKYQCEMISSKSGQGIPELLEKILLEAELLQLKANPDRMASGSVIEAMLDKGRGYVTTVMVQTGTLNIGDIVIAGAHYGRVKAMTDHRGVKIKNAGPSIPVQLLGLNGAPQAGDKFNVMETERDAREIAGKREQILREQNLRTRKHITLDEIGRRLAIGNFKELNVIVKGDVDGSVEALSDSLLKLSTEEIQVRIIHKGVGQISESDVLLAAASDAVVIGFQVRPSTPARKIAEQEQIEIRLYSIIYDAIEEVKLAMEGMLEPKVEEIIVGNVEIREVFKISKVGTIAGCMVTDGFIKRNNQIRVVRNGIVLHTGKLESLKRFKEDVSEVKFGYECGLNVAGFNDIEVGDTIESFETKEVKRLL